MVFALLHKIQTITTIMPQSKTTKPPDIQKIKCFYVYIFLKKHFICISYQSSTDAVTGKFQRYILNQISNILDKYIISLYVPGPKVSEGGPIQQTILLLCNRPWHNGTLAFRLTFCKYLDQILKT